MFAQTRPAFSQQPNAFCEAEDGVLFPSSLFMKLREIISNGQKFVNGEMWIKFCPDEQKKTSPRHERGDAKQAETCSFLVLVAVGLEAGAAVNRTIALGLEGYLGGGTAAVADYFEVLTLGTSGILAVTASSAALVAAGGIVLEALVSEELLLRSAEHEFLAAITAHKSLVFKHGWFPPFSLFCPR